MSIPQRFGRSVASSYLVSAAVGVVALVMTPVLVRGLGKDAYGVWALATAFVLYFKLLEFGIGKAIPRYVAEHAVARDDAQLSRALSTALALLCAAAAVALAIAIALTAAFPALFDVPAELRSAAQITVAIVLCDLCASVVADAFGWSLVGLHRVDLINATLIAVVVAQAVAWAIVIALGGGLVALAVVTFAISLAGQLARYRLARRLLPGLVLAPRRLYDRALVRPFLRRSTWIGVTDVAAVVGFRVDVIVVGLVVGVPAAAVYAVGQKLTFALEQLIAPTTKAFFPHASELAARQDRAGLRDALMTGTRTSLAIAAPLALALSLLAGPFVDAWVGAGFEDAAAVIVLLSCAAVVVAATRTGLLMLQGTSDVRVPALIYGSEATLNLGLSVALAHVVGLEGVALATLIASVAGAVAFVPYMCRQFDVRLRDFLGALAGAHLPPALAALAVGWLVTRAAPENFVAVAGAGAAVVGTYVLVLSATGVDRSERRLIAQAVAARATRARAGGDRA